MQETSKLLVYSYCKTDEKQKQIPLALKELIRKYTIKYKKLILFNYKYLGENTTQYDTDWVNHFGSDYKILTSILAGIVIKYKIFLNLRINIGQTVYIDIFPHQSIYTTNSNHNKYIIKTKHNETWKYCQQLITIRIFMRRATNCNCTNQSHQNIVEIFLINSEAKLHLSGNMNLWNKFMVQHKLTKKNYGIATIKLPQDFEYETNQDVTIEYEFNQDQEILKCINELSAIPISDCAQGWVCCV